MAPRPNLPFGRKKKYQDGEEIKIPKLRRALGHGSRGVCSSLIAPFLENETEIHSPLHHHHLIPSLEGGGLSQIDPEGGGIIRYGEVAINFNDSFSTVGTQEVGKGSAHSF